MIGTLLHRLFYAWHDWEFEFEVAEYMWWNAWSIHDTGKRLTERIDEFWPERRK